MATKGKLLLVDDEAPLLRLMQTYLGKLGYEVQGVAEAPDAMRQIQDASIELAIVDMSVMPGPESLVEMAASNPKARILICSGLPFEVDSLPAKVRPRFAFLQKPFLPNMLAGAVEELLKREAPARAR